MFIESMDALSIRETGINLCFSRMFYVDLLYDAFTVVRQEIMEARVVQTGGKKVVCLERCLKVELPS